MLKNPKLLLIIILILAAFFRFFRIDYPKTYVFDEVYHAFTAKEYTLGHKEAWEWWTTPPPGVAYEWTHPPLAKEIMALSITILNNSDPWAWRIPGVTISLFSIFFVYLIGIKLFQKESYALISAFVFSLDGLNFVQSRTGMNDIYFVTFMLGSLYFLLGKRVFWSALFLGLSLASKWSAIYILPLFLILLLKERNMYKFLYYLVITPIVYLLTYLPFFLDGHSIEQFIHLQQQMWWYHTGLKATHNYSSPWWSWPLNLYPVWYFVEYSQDKMANIFAVGNFVVFWSGAIALIITAFELVKKKSFNLLIPILGFLFFWLPWAISPRIMFLYHFSPSIPFLSLILGYQLGRGFEEKNSRKLAIIILALIFIGFVLLYPYLTGVFLPRDFIKLFFLTNLSKNPF